jgi:hypothetical protein
MNSPASSRAASTSKAPPPKRGHFARVDFCAVAFCLAVACWGPDSGEGAKAEAGFRRGSAVIEALERYHAAKRTFPDSLPQLVPDFIAAGALAVPPNPQERYPLEYHRETIGFVLSFRYVGPGMNKCRYSSQSSSWKCSGYY